MSVGLISAPIHKGVDEYKGQNIGETMQEKNPSGLIFDIAILISDALNNAEHIYVKTERIRNFLLGVAEVPPNSEKFAPHNSVQVDGWLQQQKVILEYLVDLIAKIDVLLNVLLEEGMDKDK